MSWLKKRLHNALVVLVRFNAWFDRHLRARPRWVAGGTVVLLLGGLIGWYWGVAVYKEYQREQKAVARFEAKLVELEEDFATGNVATMISGFRSWQQADLQLQHPIYPDQARVRLDRRLEELAVTFRDSAISTLSRPALLDMRQSLILVGQLQMLQEGPLAETWRPAVGRRLDNAVAGVLTRVEERVNRLYGPGASLSALYQAQFMIDLAARAADGKRAEQLRQVQRRISDHLALLEAQTNSPAGGGNAGKLEPVTAPSASVGRASRRARRRFAGKLQQQLASTQLVQSVRTEGDEDRVLVVGGAAQVATLTERFVYPAATRSKLRALGFREFIAQGKDGMLRFDLASQTLLEKRLRDPSEVFRSEDIVPTRGG